MKLCDKVKEVLDVACPIWMKKLCKVDFDLHKLEDFNDVHVLQDSYACCFIGEIHNNSSGYSWETNLEEHCKDCILFAIEVPKMFISATSDKEKEALLKQIAEHVKEKHPELLNKTPVENDC